MKITKEGEELVVRIPLKQQENNCYMDDGDLRLTDNLIGIVAGDEYTISQLNDLSYKGDQQEGMPILHFCDEEELRAACKTCGINIWEHSICGDCGRVIRGSFTLGNKGNQCFDCNWAEEHPKKTAQEILDSFALESKITVQHAKEIIEILETLLSNK